jgi:hypothetical protein
MAGREWGVFSCEVLFVRRQNSPYAPRRYFAPRMNMDGTNLGVMIQFFAYFLNPCAVHGHWLWSYWGVRNHFITTTYYLLGWNLRTG